MDDFTNRLGQSEDLGEIYKMEGVPGAREATFDDLCWGSKDYQKPSAYTYIYIYIYIYVPRVPAGWVTILGNINYQKPCNENPNVPKGGSPLGL